jgi:hypothetical protein
LLKTISSELDVHPQKFDSPHCTAGGIVSGQIQSLAFSAGVIFVLMATMFLSIRVGLIAMAPTFFPCVFSLVSWNDRR